MRTDIFTREGERRLHGCFKYSQKYCSRAGMHLLVLALRQVHVLVLIVGDDLKHVEIIGRHRALVLLVP